MLYNLFLCYQFATFAHRKKTNGKLLSRLVTQIQYAYIHKDQHNIHTK